MQIGFMAYSQTRYYDEIIARQIRSGRATSKTEVMHKALEMLDMVTRGSGPARSTFDGPEDLAALLRAGLASPLHELTPERRAKIRGK